MEAGAAPLAPVVSCGKQVPLPALDLGEVGAPGLGEAAEQLLIGALCGRRAFFHKEIPGSRARSGGVADNGLAGASAGRGCARAGSVTGYEGGKKRGCRRGVTVLKA